jgi:hypothetical protein
MSIYAIHLSRHLTLDFSEKFSKVGVGGREGGRTGRWVKYVVLGHRPQLRCLAEGKKKAQLENPSSGLSDY